MRRYACPACVLWVLAWLSICPSARGFAHAEVADVIEDVEMASLDGGRQRLLSDAKANVFIFFRPDQENSRDTMRKISGLEKEMSGKPVRWVGIVSDRFPREEVLAFAKEAGIGMPVLVDAGDALYGRLGVALQPVVGIADGNRTLVAYQPFMKVNYIETIRARIRRVLGEIGDPEVEEAIHPPAAKTDTADAAARRRLLLAEKLLASGKHEKALESVEKCIAADPGSAAAHALRGDILAAQGRCAEAVREYEEALRADPGSARASEGMKRCAEKGK
ncbi:MAG: tetratricopeptide repeat protein [Deltaproteobacteria bacterium]|nr:tetratricopeptide repeat protein [Deltaproteobacteria bacterium]